MQAQLKAHEYVSKKQPEILIVLLHGYGANGMDLLGMKDSFISVLGDNIIVSAPDAPQLCEIGVGLDSHQWFSLADRSVEAMEKGAKEAHFILKTYIEDKLSQYGLTSKQLVLIGFSQGCMMTLYTGLRLQNAPVALIGWSGRFIEGDDASSYKVPIQLWHGAEDNVVLPECFVESLSKLRALGLKVEGHMIKNVAHHITEEILEGSLGFIKKHFMSGSSFKSL